jgi:hypothetical protein
MINADLTARILNKLGSKVVMKACYRNALLALKLMPPGAMYVEGGAVCDFKNGQMMIEHGWCIDPDGLVVDVTLAANKTDVVSYHPWLVLSPGELIVGGILTDTLLPASKLIIEVAINNEFFQKVYGANARGKRNDVMRDKARISLGDR